MASINVDSTKTVLFVHGALHTSYHWTTLPAAVSKYGYNTHAVNLPSVGVREHPPADHLEDIAHVRSALDDLIRNKKQKVLLVGHSWGGVVASSAVEGYEKDILGIVFLDAPMVPEGHPTSEYMKMPEEWIRPVTDFYAETTHPYEAFYHDVSRHEAQPLIDRLQPQCINVLSGRISYAAWKHDVKCVYVACTESAALPQEFRTPMLDEVRSDAKHPIVYKELPASHTPWLKWENELVMWIREAAGEDLH